MIAIRTDANNEIAMGHVMRCLSIAKQIEKQGNRIVFIISEAYTEDLIIKSGFEVLCLNNSYKEKDNEISVVLRLIDELRIDVMLVDSYEISENYLSKIKEKTRIVYMDDLNKFRYDADIVVNYSYYISEDDYLQYRYTDETKFLLGPKYTPLREQFQSEPIAVKDEIESIFITSGGTDNYHIIRLILEKINDIKGLESYKKKIVIGKFYNDIVWLYEHAKMNENIEVFQNISNMKEIMSQCDLAISAGGTTISELCSCGIPTIAFSMADNQINGIKSFAEDGMLIYVGDVRDEQEDIAEKIIDQITNLVCNFEKRKKLSEKARNSIDGFGASRIANEICQLFNT